MIEFSVVSGLIKCTQNPQLFFYMSEVIEKKPLELNEKVEFSVVPVSHCCVCPRGLDQTISQRLTVKQH